MPKISVPQKNTNLAVKAGVNLMESLVSAGFPVASSCLGDGICGKCRMIVEGEVPPAQKLETETLNRNGGGPNERLACQVAVDSDIKVTTGYW